MPDSSAILALPYIQPSQAQKHVTHNEALRRLDILVQLSVAGFDAETPPAVPDETELHALGAAPTGAWAGQAGMLAAWSGDSWIFVAPQEGWRAWGRAEQELRVWTGGTWVRPAPDLDNLAGVGIGTQADAENRLAVKADATLLSHDGGGHRLKINKAAAAETASVLFQSDWTGHAEIGLAGGTDLSFKVSPDGAAWTEALCLAGTGQVGIGAAPGLGRLDIAQTSAAEMGLRVRCLSTGYTGAALVVPVSTPAAATYSFLAAYSSGGDLEFRLRGDGNASCDGAWTGGGADYAEFFEWADGNPQAEDRVGLSVVLDGDRIRPAQAGEEPIGVISGNPSVVGDGDAERWKGKYLRDAFGRYLHEDYVAVEWTDAAGHRHSHDEAAVPAEVTVPADAVRSVRPRRRLNPAYDPAAPYVGRAGRPEWDMVGLMGKLRLRRGQPVGPRWIRMRAVGDGVEEWLVR